MEYGTVKWWIYSENTGEPVRWSRSHLWESVEKTVCGSVIPEDDDRLIIVHWGVDEVTCDRCYSIKERRYAQQVKQEKSDLFDLRLKTCISNSPVFRFNLFTLDECKTELKETDGRRVAAALLRIGYVRRNNLWTKPVVHDHSRAYGNGKL